MTMQVDTTTMSLPPAVVLDITALPAATVSLTVSRILADAAPLRVRGASAALVGQTAQVTDWDAPVGVPISYRIQATAKDGTILETATSTPDPVPDTGSGCWLSDPLNPGAAQLVNMLISSEEQRTYSRQVDFTWPAGSDVARANVGSIRRQATSHIELCTWGEEDATSLRQLLMQIPVLLYRPPAGALVPSVIYGVSPDIVEEQQRPFPGQPHIHWTLEITPTRGPGRDVVIPTIVWRDVINTYATWRDVIPANRSWRDLLISHNQT